MTLTLDLTPSEEAEVIRSAEREGVPLAEQAADLRARYNLRTPDAVQIATAIDTGCDAFLTNDIALKRVTEICVIVLSELTL